MTLFITAARAAAVSSFRGAQNSLRKSTHRLLTETLLLGVVAGGVVSLVRWVIFRELMTRGHAIGATVFLLVYLGVIIAVMTTLAAFILYKTGRCRCCRGVDDDDDGGGNFIFSSSSSIEQFSNLVASVAIVYCILLMSNSVYHRLFRFSISKESRKNQDFGYLDQSYDNGQFHF